MTDEFKVDDLTWLWRTGASLMPQVGRQFSLAAIALHRTGDKAAMFQTSQGPSPLSGPFGVLRDTAQERILGAAAERCVKAGEALMRIADAYATTDYYSAADLKTYAEETADIRAGGNAVFPIPEVPDPPAAGDPHPAGE